MVGTIITTASTLKAVLCYIDPTKTPKIAYDNHELVEPLIEKVKKALGDHDGSQSVTITFGYGEEELARQFSGVCENIAYIFADITKCSK